MADDDSMSRTSDPSLWSRLETYSLDQPGVSMPFSARLARQTGWSSEFTQRVIQEYKRFIYLMCVSEETLTPSQEVDEVWHLHLIYTRDYWIDFCRDVLGREIHHDPTEGGAVESARYGNCYRRTKVRYREEFNMTPPLDIWPHEQFRRLAISPHQLVAIPERHQEPSRYRWLPCHSGAVCGMEF
jgi:hypothetical protein